MKEIVFAVGASVCLSACSGQYEPEVVGAKSASYQSDLSECRLVAASIVGNDQPVQTGAMIGAALGGVLGALDDDGNPAENAAAGALVGAGAGAIEGLEEVDVIERAAIRSCLIERGYTVRS